MKILKFTLLSLALSAAMMTEVDAQGRGNGAVRSEHKSEGNRPNPIVQNSNRNGSNNSIRIDNNRNEHTNVQGNRNSGREAVRIHDIDNRGNREIARKDNDRPNYGNSNSNIIYNGNHNDRRNPIKINANSGNYKYSYNKPVKRINVNNYYNYSYNNMNFYGRDGIFYRYHKNNYYRIMPPVGFSINLLPIGSITINIGSRPYYFYEGVYYERYRSEYRVVEPPMGAIVYALPSGYERVDYYGNYYYEYAGVLYEKIYHRGDTAYQVVGYLS